MKKLRKVQLRKFMKAGSAFALSLATLLLGVPVAQQAEAADDSALYWVTDDSSTVVESTTAYATGGTEVSAPTYTLVATTSKSEGIASLIIAEATPTFSFASSYVSKTYGDSSFTNSLTNTSDGDVTYSSGDTSVATVSSSGRVTIVGVGSTRITASVAKTFNYAAATASYILTVSKATPDIYWASSSVTTTYGSYGSSINRLAYRTDGTLSYSSSNTSVATVSSSGAISIEGPGTTTITAYANEGTYYKSGSASFTLTVTKRDATLYFVSSSVSKTYGDGSFSNELKSTTDGSISYSSSNTSVATVNSSGTVTIKGAGSARITATSAATSSYDSASASYIVTVERAQPSLSFALSIESRQVGADEFTNKLTANTDGDISYRSSNTKVATVSGSGVVTVKGTGTTTITASSGSTARYKAGSCSYTLIVTKKPPAKIDVKETFSKTCKNQKQTFSLGAKTNSGGKLTYKSSNKSKVKVSSKGKVTIAKGFAGTATIVIKAKETKNYASATEKVVVNVKLAAPKIKSVTSPIAGGIEVTWKTVTGAKYYNVLISLDSSFPSGEGLTWIEPVYSKSSFKTGKEFLGGKTCYVKVLACVDDDFCTSSSKESVKVK